MDRIADFIASLGFLILDRVLVVQALTHASWVHEHPGGAAGHNERLEFLGDSVISVIVSERLYQLHPTDDEGVLSSRRAAIVSTSGLARIAARLNVGDALRLGEGEAAHGGRVRPLLLASALEAVVGAIFVDRGLTAASRWFCKVADPELNAALGASVLKSPKSRLQEWTQRHGGSRPEYRVIEAAGPDHEKVFKIDVAIDGAPLGRGVGPSRRAAETAAAAEALTVLLERARPIADPDDGHQ